LSEALGYATDGDYRIYEADIRIAFAWVHLAEDEPIAACQEAARARTMSQEMGYHWGQVDVDEVLAPTLDNPYSQTMTANRPFPQADL
jgi:hypothetical protein